MMSWQKEKHDHMQSIVLSDAQQATQGKPELNLACSTQYEETLAS